MEVGNRRQTDRSPMAQINVTPLVDVMLVLLIIFMVTASMGQQGITVNLPKTPAAALPVKEDTVTVSIDDQLRIFLNAEVVPREELSKKLTELYSHRTNKGVFLKADRAIPYGEFVKIVALIKVSGVEKLGMLTDAPVSQVSP